jgi:hypothetical protein
VFGPFADVQTIGNQGGESSSYRDEGSIPFTRSMLPPQFPGFRHYYSATVFVYSNKEKLDMPNYFSSTDTREQPVWKPAAD